MKNFFITGTDTDVGKTITSAVLTFALKANYWKPMQSGLINTAPESETVQALTQLSDAHFLPSLYALQANLAIAQAAELENKIINLEKCTLPFSKNSLIIEGGGGVFHPLNASETMMDLMKKLNIPVIIVSRGTLGTINHTLLTIEALKQRNITIYGIIFCGMLDIKNKNTIEQWSTVRTLFHIPYFKNLTPETLQNWVLEQQALILESLA